MASFGKQVADFKKKAIVATEELSRAVTLELFSSVISDSPVDSGMFRGNWFASSKSPDVQTTDNIRSESQVIADAANVVSDFKLNDTLYLTNSLPYGPRLEYEGWSKRKAPEGMVRINVQRIAANLNSRTN